MMLTAKQIAGNQKRSVRAMIEKIEKMADAFADIDGILESQAEQLKMAAEAYLEELQRCIDDDA